MNGLDVHLLEAGEEKAPALLLLHGFPELAWSWRKVMVPLAAAGYRVLAPDLRGYGRTTGWDASYDGDLRAFSFPNLALDVLQLLKKLEIKAVDAVVGHDFGSPAAAWCALLHPETFRRAALMSAPFAGPPAAAQMPHDPVHDEMARLPRPRKHYQWYYSTRPADDDMAKCPQGLHAFLRAYYHVKSADWKDNQPYELAGWTATELAKLPTYYVMDLGQTMAQTVAPHMPSAAEIAACRWLPDAELAVYSAEYGRNGFQGGLQWYRYRTSGLYNRELAMHAGKRITVPACFISGASDWGPYQAPGALKKMREDAFADDRGCHFIPGAGHWVQQEQPEAVVRLLLAFLKSS